MIFPFVGLALAVVWSLRLAASRYGARLASGRASAAAGIAALVVVLAAEAAGTHVRNNVWRTEDTLWRDVTIKSPRNGRGLENYGIQFARRGDYVTALSYLERAQALDPTNPLIEMNLGMTLVNMNRKAEAEQHYHRSLELSDSPDMHYLYGNWLYYQGRIVESQQHLEAAIRGNRLSFPARMLLMKIYSDQGNIFELNRLFEETIQMAYDKEAVERFRAERDRYDKKMKEAMANRRAAKTGNKLDTPEGLTREAAELCSAKKYEDCLSTVQAAIILRPNYAEAYNNKAYALLAMNRLDEAIQAWQEAVRLKPDYTIAKNNLARAMEDRRRRQLATRMMR